MEFKNLIKSVPDHPKPGILFRDIQPLLEDSEQFFEVIYGMGELINLEVVDYFVGIESRGFIFASALASINLKGLKMIRKAGKLPPENLHTVVYKTEYSLDTIQMQKGSGNIVLVDDVFATGGTMEAAHQLATDAGYTIIDSLCLLDIGIVKNHNTKCLISY